jgi:hypothetical protein
MESMSARLESAFGQRHMYTSIQKKLRANVFQTVISNTLRDIFHAGAPAFASSLGTF